MTPSSGCVSISVCLAWFVASAGAPAARADFVWENPITSGLPGYGQKDFHILADGGRWYLVATEQPNPKVGKRGLVLYVSENLRHWKETTVLFERAQLPRECWYRDEWAAPELHRVKGRYVLTFNSRNNRLRPYKKLGFGLAVADRVAGPYRIVNTEKPLFEGNNTNLFVDDDGTARLYWDMDGRILAAGIDLETGTLKSEPREILGPAELGGDFRFLDAPFVTRRGDTYHMITSSFYAGYIIRVRHLTAPGPLGPWRLAPEPLMTFIESEAETVVKMPYEPGFTFAPPTQVVFHHQIIQGPGGLDYIIYHSSEKYAEPYLVIEPVLFGADSSLRVVNNKARQQRVVLP